MTNKFQHEMAYYERPAQANGTPAYGVATLFALQQILMERSYH